MRKIELEVLTAEGCAHCHEFLKFWNAEAPSWNGVTLREIDVLDIEGQHMMTKYCIFKLPGIVARGVLIGKGEIDKEEFRSTLALLSQ